MADIRVRNLSQEAAESCYEAYLKGERPKEGTILVSGPVVVFTSDTFEMKVKHWKTARRNSSPSWTTKPRAGRPFANTKTAAASPQAQPLLP